VPIAEYAAGAQLTQPNKEYIYSGSGLLATIDASAGLSYQFPDHLSTRVEADASATVTRSFGHFPFGEPWYETGAASKWKFTSYERDVESNLDYADFRFYSSRLGRFMSADLLAGDAGDPASLDRYSYVLGDPISLVDPFGLDSSFGGSCVGFIEVDVINGTSYVTTHLWCEGIGGGGIGHPAPVWEEQGGGLGLRLPNESFSQCMQNNAGNYSLLGVVDFAIGANGEVANNYWLGMTPASNSLTNVFNALTGSLASLTQLTPSIVRAGMGNVLTSGSRTSSLMSLNLAGAPGGPKGGYPALGPATSNVNAARAAAAAQLKLAADAGFFLAELAGCLGPR
jgi:RHS repeat-associated protein